jgi:hypothetical protein
MKVLAAQATTPLAGLPRYQKGEGSAAAGGCKVPATECAVPGTDAQESRPAGTACTEGIAQVRAEPTPGGAIYTRR